MLLRNTAPSVTINSPGCTPSRICELRQHAGAQLGVRVGDFRTYGDPVGCRIDGGVDARHLACKCAPRIRHHRERQRLSGPHRHAVALRDVGEGPHPVRPRLVRNRAAGEHAVDLVVRFAERTQGIACRLESGACALLARDRLLELLLRDPVAFTEVLDAP